MAATRFAYVKEYELPDSILPNTYFVVRVDGQSFHRFSDVHGFQKPNDEQALRLMDHAARDVMQALNGNVVLGFGESDEFSFLFKRSCSLYKRRDSKIVTTVVSQFTSSYVFHWPTYFPLTTLKYPPTFDGRLVVYPSERNVKDYFAWRQADTHINNLYNTTFWALIQKGGLTTAQAHEKLKGTTSSDKNEILHGQFEVNYNVLPERFRKGSVLVQESSKASDVPIAREDITLPGDEHGPSVETMQGSTASAEAPDRKAHRLHRKAQKKSAREAKRTATIGVLHCDVIGPSFWEDYPNILND